ncbi:superoxide dismutase [Gregarina niphandrodes]|uniref:Superoxide dismutase n=1 Tax=Gregarina niphandrodes TaxID=110365 RepID=A0A023B9G3_GRENI|nr:superoxide dismutase [Gregarina niphandrodes]EZG72883.1 superoxide dismutase [Gregarina niphandrodes]|eukprot:XP_011129742.1 superoxide dismutase [Gregarina niphandrodes]
MDFIPEPKLPYALNALEPHISAETLKFHHGKHHMAYYNKTKELTQGKTPVTLEELVATAEGGLYDQAAQLWNHGFYWQCLGSNPDSKDVRKPTGPIADLINSSFGSFDAFKEKFDTMAKGAFGSGWVWLVKKGDKLELMEGHDGDCPLKGDRGRPLLTIDLWEHAYYIDYKNSRPDYITAYWSLVNWDFVNQQLGAKTYSYQKAN